MGGGGGGGREEDGAGCIAPAPSGIGGARLIGLLGNVIISSSVLMRGVDRDKDTDDRDGSDGAFVGVVIVGLSSLLLSRPEAFTCTFSVWMDRSSSDSSPVLEDS